MARKTVSQEDKFRMKLDEMFAQIQHYLREVQLKIHDDESENIRKDCISECIILNHNISEKLGACIHRA